MNCHQCDGNDEQCLACDGTGHVCDICGEACPEVGMDLCAKCMELNRRQKVEDQSSDTTSA
jgi:hypothetical protein